MYVATERGTSDNPEATRFSQCAHDQRRRLEAEDSVRQHPMCPINIRWEETYTPTTLPRSRSPHNVLHSPSYVSSALYSPIHYSIVFPFFFPDAYLASQARRLAISWGGSFPQLVAYGKVLLKIGHLLERDVKSKAL